MRILFVAPYVPDLIRVRPYNFVRELARRHEVAVLAAQTGAKAGAVGDLRSFCRRVEVVPIDLSDSLRSCAKAFLQGEPLQAAFCRSWELERRLAALLAEEVFDVVHVEHLRAAHARASIPGSLPTVFDAVDCISLLLERTLCASHSLRQRAIAALELRRTRTFEARLLRSYDLTVVTSPEDGRALEALAPDRAVAVVPNGVDLEYFRPVPGPRDPATLVLSGKMSYHANVTAVFDFYRRVWPLVRERHPGARLLIAGSGPPAAVRALGRDRAVTITGHLPDIRQALARATVAICPVKVKVGIQNKVLEAMAMGLPVVCTAEGAQGLAAQHEQDFLVARGPQEFAAHVCRLLADAELRERLGVAGRRYVERHHRWDVAVQSLEAVYAEAIDRHAPGHDAPVPHARRRPGVRPA